MKNRKYLLSVVCFLLFIFFWLFSIRAVFLGQVSGNFRPLVLTDEYVRLKNVLVSDTKPSRVLWLPKKDAFAFASDVHPLLTSEQLFGSASVSGIISQSVVADFSLRLGEAGVGYVVVPQDLEKRIFLDDYRFDPSQRKKLIDALDPTLLKRDTRFVNLAVYRNDQFTMKTEVPPAAVRKQSLVNAGLVVSVVSLIVAGALVVL